MKKLLLLIIGMFSVVVLSQAKPPKWAKKLPKPENQTYFYSCESAADENEEQARNKALAKVMQNSLHRLGATVNSSAVSEALRNGNVINTGDCALIGINPVCGYTEKIKGGYRYYILCQVSKQAPTEFWQPKYTSFRDCGPQASNDMIEIDYPEAWRIYESEEYIASFKREHYEGGKIKQSQALADLYELAERDLSMKLGIDEGDVEFLAYTGKKEKVYNRGEDVMVVYYISREQLLNYYQAKDSMYMDYMNGSISQAQELIDQAKTITDAARQLKDDPSSLLEEAKSLREEAEVKLQFAQQQLHEAKRYTDLRKAYGADAAKEQQLQASCSDRIMSMLKEVQGNKARNKQEEKVNEYIRTALKAQKDARISEALKYYYWAYVLLNSIDPSGSIKYEKEPANKWLPTKIKEILKEISFSYAGEAPDDPTMGIVNVTYQKKSVKSLDYRYYTNIGWSEAFRAKDGTGVIRFYENENKEKKLTLKIEYLFLSESYVDKEIAVLLNNDQTEFDKEATKELNIQKITEMKEEGTNFPIPLKAGAVHSISNAKEGKYAGVTTAEVLSEEESKPYRQKIDFICDAITNRQGNTALSYFTPQGMKLYIQLTNSGRVTIVDKKNIRFIRIGNTVVARSIQMSFAYPTNHKTFKEDVIFEFNEDKKIDNLRYMLERTTIEDIGKHSDWSDAAKMALVDFLEKYKSSYALRNTAYLDSVFDANALIITGKVKPIMSDQKNIKFGNNEYVEYTRHTKQSFLKNLNNVFKTNCFVNLSFGDLLVLPKKDSSYPNIYGIRIKQDYSVASGYGDSGYLFLLMDLSDYEHPIIHVRTWQPKPDYDKLPGNGLYGPSDFLL